MAHRPSAATISIRRRALRAAAICAAAPLLVASFAKAQVNLDFESAPTVGGVHGWRTRGDGAVIRVDSATARSGARSLRVEAHAQSGRDGFAQDIDARHIDGDRLRLSAFVRFDPTSAVEPSLRVRVDGGGRLLYIGRAQTSSTSDASGWYHIVIDAPLSARAERINIGGDVSGDGVVWFDDFSVESLAARTLPPPSPEAERYVRRALEIIEANAVTRADIDWPAYRDAVMTQARGATDPRDAHLALQFALAELGDGHSYFMSPRQMSRLDAEPLGNARSGREVRPPEARMIFDGIGYLRLPGIAGGEHLDRVAFAETVQASIGKLAAQAITGWILDLRGNEGGNLWPMLAGVGPLLGDGEVGASLRPDGERRPIWYHDGKAGLGDYVQLRVRGDPVRLDHDSVPIAVLLDDETASAAEIVALAFAGHASAHSFGAPTAGATAATRTFPLSDGAALMLAVASVMDRTGRLIDGPVVPDTLVAEMGRDGVPLDAQPVVLAARQWLEANR